jgi:hypothetical protein
MIPRSSGVDAVEVEGAEPNTVIEERELTAPSGPFWFSLNQESGIWPAGRYKVELFLDDELNQSMEFQVRPPSQTRPPLRRSPGCCNQGAVTTSRAGVHRAG